MTVIAAPLRGRIDTALNEFVRQQVDQESSRWDTEISSLISEYVADGGKRLRPELCYWGWRAAGGGDEETIIKAAASLELFHAFCLAHDDVIDKSDTRRGKLSLHRRLEEIHRERGWRGSPEEFGRHMAILIGDLLFAWSDQMYQESGISSTSLATARPILARMRCEVFGGEQLDLKGPQTNSTLRDVLRAIEYKAARYTVQRPLEIGALLTGESYPSMISDLAAFGVPLGMAFQLRDDVLGVFGDPTVTGKSVLDDIREDKQTALVVFARDLACDEERAVLDYWYGNPGITADGGEMVRRALRSSGAVEAVENMISALVLDARKALKQSTVHPDAGSALLELTDRLTRRDA